MPRGVRIEYAGAFYHVMARGNRREAIFNDDDDRRFFLRTLGDACRRTGWRVHAWVLLTNHYHLFLETPEANLSAGMGWLQNAYTRRFNTRHRVWGRLFGDRYKAVLVEGRCGYYYETLLDYLHLNPVRAGLVRPARGQSVLDYLWSSVAGGHARPPRQRPEWLATEPALEAFGMTDTVRGRRQWVERLDSRALKEDTAGCGAVPLPAGLDARCSHLRRGWYWGSQAFAERMLKLAGASLGEKRNRNYRGSLERKAHDAARAEELLAGGLKAAGLGLEEALRLPGSEPRKITIARIIRERTTVSQSWLAERLGMSSAANVSQQLRRHRNASQKRKVPPALKEWATLSNVAD